MAEQDAQTAAERQGYGVGVPALNAARTLHAALDSILAQTVAAAAVIVVDDGSTDSTARIATTFGPPVRVVSQDNRGPADATDRGWAELDTPLLAALDADDLWRPDKAERQIAALAASPGLDAVFCRATVFAHGSDPAAASRTQDLWGRSAIMIRREAALRLGPVQAAGGGRELGEMIRWIDRGRRLGLVFRMMPEILADRRIIPGSLSHGRTASALLSVVRDRLRNP